MPAEPYRFGRWLTAKVNLDYHIAVDDHFYSVPYRLVHKKVEVFLTSTAVAVFLRGERVASHTRSHAKGKHTTLAEHLPPAHQAMATRTPDRLRDQAQAIGIATAAYVDRLLTGRDHPEQGIRSCLGILRLAGAYGRDRIEAACQRALAARVLSSRYVERLLKNGRLDLTDLPPADGPGHHRNIRGPGYYN